MFSIWLRVLVNGNVAVFLPRLPAFSKEHLGSIKDLVIPRDEAYLIISSN